MQLTQFASHSVVHPAHWMSIRILFAAFFLFGLTMPVAIGQKQEDFKDFDTLMNEAASRTRSNSPALPRSASPTQEAETLPSGRGTDLPNSSASETSIPSFERFVPESRSGSNGASSISRPVFPDRRDTAEPFPTRPQAEVDDPRNSIPLPQLNGGGLVIRNVSDQNQSAFDWSRQTTSIADLRFPTATVFQHGDAFMAPAEESAYLDLIDAIAEQRRFLIRQTSDEVVQRTVELRQASGDDSITVSAKGRSVWQESFYQFANARRLAWNNGHLRNGELRDEIGGLPNPFAPASKADKKISDAEAPYHLTDDILRFPSDYVGRPVVLYGRFSAASVVRLGTDLRGRTGYEQRSFNGAGQYDGTYDGTRRAEVRLMRGSLTALNSSEQLAMVDARELLTPQLGSLQPNEWPGEEASVPVMVKGWVVKKWDSRPLIYCESMRQISPIPHFSLVRQNTIDKSRLRDEEKWLYYETLSQMALTSDRVQREVARSVLYQRIDDLMVQVKNKADADMTQLGARLKSAAITDDQYRQRKVSVQRRLNQRVARYRNYRRHPEDFQTFVDLFQHPDFWHGHLVTLRGHVRHVVSYPGDETLFDGKPLHELWLFTDDSQHNPAVIVTTEIPGDFPRNADVIDRVTVTGCFFKRYIYGSQDADRIAPLLLAGRVQWQPTVDQVQALVADGHLPAKSPRAVQAAAMGAGMSDAAMMLVCFFIVLTFMILWGRAQREERDRVRLRKRVNDVPEFDNPVLPGDLPPETDVGYEYAVSAAGTYAAERADTGRL